jgi:hypothetical protein
MATESGGSRFMQQDEIERFVRDRLGCRCPPEVFLNVDLTTRPGAAGSDPYLRLALGRRLLIHMVNLASHGQFAAALARCAQSGLEERDAGGFNRFRLVWVAPDGAAGATTALAEAFAAATGGDARAHLHVLAADQVPASLQPVTAPRT